MSIFDEQIKKRNQLETELFTESYRKLAEVVTGDQNGLKLDQGMLLNRRVIEDIAEVLNITVPYSLHEDYSVQYYLDKLFRPRGVMWREIRLGERWYTDAMGVMLGSLEDGRRVALIPYGLNGYAYRDPDTGKKIPVTSMTAKKIQRDATLFYRPLPLRPLKTRDIMVYLYKCSSRGDILLYVMTSIAVVLLSMMTPAMTKVLFSTVVATGNSRLLISIFILLIVASVTSLIFSIINRLVLPRIAARVAVPLQAAFMMRVLTAPVSKVRDFSAGDLGARLGGLYNHVRILLSMFLSSILTVLCSLISFFQMFSFSRTLGFAALGFTVLMCVLYIAVTKKTYDLGCERMDADAAESGLTFSLIDGIQKITVSGAEKRAFTQWSRVYRRSVQTEFNPPLLLKVYVPLSSIILTVASVVMLYLSWKMKLPTASYYSFTTSFGIVTGALGTIGSGISGFAGSLPIFRMLRPVMNMVPEIGGGKEIVKSLSGNIRMEHVTFGYVKDQPPVINDLSLNIRAGEYVAIVGSSGCGKSTLMKLLLGFERPVSGEIIYDSKPLEELDIASVRRKIGTVLQNGELIQGTIFSNITITGSGLTYDDAWRAAEFAGIAEDIRKMPMEMNTHITDGGRGISGGQKQRLLIARAIINNPKILFFDEATSALDNLTQRAVTESLGALNCTRVVIAHRLSTIQNCDRIFCLDKGRVVEEGTYDELMQKNGFFTELVKRQQV